MYEKKKKLLADIFTDNSVLQRNKPVRIFGKSNAGKGAVVTVSVSSDDRDYVRATATGVVTEDGSFEVILPPMRAAVDVTLTATDGVETVTLHNLAYGEVWLAGGQSNMEYELVNCKEWEECKETVNTDVRFFYTPKHDYMDDAYFEDFDNQCWNIADANAENFKHWSAIGYMYADKLQKKLGCTVGVIGCNWGGTSATAWMSRDYVIANKKTRIYVDEFECGEPMKPSIIEQKKIYDDFVIYHNEWNKKMEQLYIDKPGIEWSEIEEILGKCQWPGPMNNYNPFRPYGHYRDMIKPIAPYTLAGFIYYQGESDDHHPEVYEDLFPALIACWRDEWKDNTLPFLFTQLTIHKYKADADFKNWCLIREAQLNTFRTIKNTGMAVSVDSGEFNEIHPKSKRNIADRLSNQALDMFYSIATDVEGFGPIYRCACPMGDGVIRIYFDYVFDGFEIKDLKYNPAEVDDKIIESTPARFEVAGIDGKYVTAEVVGEGLDYIDLKANSDTSVGGGVVENPIKARYMWTNYGLPILFGGNGIPASPFRSDKD